MIVNPLTAIRLAALAFMLMGAVTFTYSSVSKSNMLREQRQTIAALNRDVSLSRNTEASLQNKIAELRIQSDMNISRIDEYERELKQRGSAASCVLDDNDARSLRQFR